MGWLILLIAYVVGPVLVIGLMNWILSGFPLPGKPSKGRRYGKDDNFFSLAGPAALMCLAPIAYLIFVAHYVFEGLSFTLAKLLGAA